MLEDFLKALLIVGGGPVLLALCMLPGALKADRENEKERERLKKAGSFVPDEGDSHECPRSPNHHTQQGNRAKDGFDMEAEMSDPGVTGQVTINGQRYFYARKRLHDVLYADGGNPLLWFAWDSDDNLVVAGTKTKREMITGLWEQETQP